MIDLSNSLIRLAAGCVLLTVGTTAANAGPPPVVVSKSTLTYTPGHPVGPVVSTDAYHQSSDLVTGEFFAHSDTTINLNSAPGVTAFATSIIPRQPNSYGSQAIAGLQYYFTVNGPEAIDVPVLFTGFTQLSRAGVDGGALSSFLTFDASGRNISNQQFACTVSVNGCGVTNFFQIANFKSVVLGGAAFSGSIQIQAVADAIFNPTSPPGPTTFTGYAYIDPFVAIDPTFLSSHPGYSLSFSAGVGNAPISGVPESTTWAMLTFGFGVVGGAMRCRSRRLASS